VAQKILYKLLGDNFEVLKKSIFELKMADRVRYFLEQSVAELDDLRKKELFTKQELAMIMRRRTDFEHRINGRSARSKDFLRYSEYEMNVERLRLKRTKRLGGKNEGGPTISDWAGPRRILFIFERATTKFAGDIPLWLQYLEYAKQQSAIHVINKVFTCMLQLHPTKPKLWILAAKREADDNASMKAARSLMQRGLRFNRDSTLMWYEYTKLELIYVSKILARRKLLGLKAVEEEKQLDEQVEHITLPEASTEESIQTDLKSLPDADISMLGNAETNPALRGDVALAIYDAAVETMPSQAKKFAFSLEILDLFDSFPDLDRQHICRHVIEFVDLNIGSPETNLLAITLPLRHTSHDDPSFPDMLKLTIALFNKDSKSPELKRLLRDHLNEKYMERELTPCLDENIKLVLSLFLKRLS
jgi:U3 small nucleolar RNA-associated protein 6